MFCGFVRLCDNNNLASGSTISRQLPCVCDTFRLAREQRASAAFKWYATTPGMPDLSILTQEQAPHATPASEFLAPTPALVARQATTTVITQSGTTCSGQYSGGTLAGAIVGTFFGTLLLLWLIQALQNNNAGNRREEVIVERKRRRGGRSRSGSSSGVRRPSRVYSG